jgi:hypothetical protein
MSNRHIAPLLLVLLAVALTVGISGWLRAPVARGGESASGDAARSGDDAERDVRGAGLAPVAPSGRAMATSPDPVDLQLVQDLVQANDAAVTEMANAGERKLRGRYESEGVDAGWAPGKQRILEERSVSRQILEANASPVAFNATCRSSVCRITADFASSVAANDWYTLYTLNAGGELFASSVRGTPNPDGSVHLEIYASTRQ